ncbi:MAG TPA: zincin-like metallopeptidase domain-containing protein [Rhizomicrobium sp.]|jgi:antirestriction protein ArdC
MQDTVLSRRYDIYGAITEKIVRAMKEAKGTYRMPWHSGDAPLDLPVNAHTDHPYRGVNILSLWLDAQARGYPTGYWASYKQWQLLDAQVRHQERGCLIIFYKKLDQTEMERQSGELARYVGKATHVFNAAQVDNWTPPERKQIAPVEIDKTVDAFVQATGARVGHGYSMAQYRTDLDTIEMPSPAWFFDTPTRTASQGYHGVLFHELTHWTGPSHRCDREFGRRFGDKKYAFEELVAELGAAFLCAAFKIANEPREDHAAYLADWLSLLSNDPRVIFTAANKAQEAIEYLGSAATGALDGVPEVA